jgi:hypothetical protein
VNTVLIARVASLDLRAKVAQPERLLCATFSVLAICLPAA